MARKIKIVISVLEIVFAFLFFIYPAAQIVRFISNSERIAANKSDLIPEMFEGTSRRFAAWSDGFLESNYAESVDQQSVAGTEWPMFGAVFFLVTAADIKDQDPSIANAPRFHQAVENAGRIVASPVTATWVRNMWGNAYLQSENVFYRMLLIMGLASYEELTGNTQYHSLMREQRIALAEELVNARFHLLDDYPGECYPNDILWAVAAIQQAAALDGDAHNELVTSVMETFNNSIISSQGIPAFMMNSKTGLLAQNPRGCGNSGILIFAPELDLEIASHWYSTYEKQFWKKNWLAAGFTEFPLGADVPFNDVDSGPVIMEFGSVATAFGIGAAKTMGRMDHAVPMTAEILATSWPTPFGLLIPGIMGYLAVDSWCLGEVAIMFSLTRPTLTDTIVPYNGGYPMVVWFLLAFYGGIGLLIIGLRLRGVGVLGPSHTRPLNHR